MTEKKGQKPGKRSIPDAWFSGREAPRNITPEAGGRRRPIWENEKCIKCGVCYIYCPEGCITETADGFFEANLDYCKGCGICAHECWPKAIKMVNEED